MSNENRKIMSNRIKQMKGTHKMKRLRDPSCEKMKGLNLPFSFCLYHSSHYFIPLVLSSFFLLFYFQKIQQMNGSIGFSPHQSKQLKDWSPILFLQYGQNLEKPQRFFFSRLIFQRIDKE